MKILKKKLDEQRKDLYSKIEVLKSSLKILSNQKISNKKVFKKALVSSEKILRDFEDIVYDARNRLNNDVEKKIYTILERAGAHPHIDFDDINEGKVTTWVVSTSDKPVTKEEARIIKKYFRDCGNMTIITFLPKPR